MRIPTMALWAAGCGGGPWCELPDPEPVEQPNLLLVVIDDVGLEQLDRWDSPDPVPTPTLDCLCDAGLRFDNVWAAPFCTPARTALLSGVHPRRAGIGRFINVGQSRWEMPLEWVTMAEAVAEVGYSTAFYGKWHVGAFMAPSGRDHPNLQGFETYSGGLGNIDHLSELGPRGTYFAWEHLTNGQERWREGYLTTATVDDALAGLDDLPEPWLLVLSFHGAHSPLHRPPGRLHTQSLGGSPSEISRYRAMVESVDTELSRFLEGIEPRVLGRTQIWTMSDNGTPSHGISGDFDFMGAKGTLHEPGLRIPMVVTGVGVEARGQRTEALTSILDVYPTMLARAAAPVGFSDGVAMTEVLSDPAASHRDVVYADLTDPDGSLSYTVRTLDRKLLRTVADTERAFVVGPGLTEELVDEEWEDLSGLLDERIERFADPPPLP
ncbi:MAG: sulfatase-like hydrolase/transferase [Myxococcales bacterium]|nr:sulfatase-like hydrolase/transferase [Myxococcales bacterium]